MKVRTKAFHSKVKSKASLVSQKKTGNYEMTQKLFKEWKDINTIAKEMDLTPITIENHILKLYERGDLWLVDMMKLFDLKHLKQVKDIIEQFFSWDTDRLKPIKEKLEEEWFTYMSYFEIKAALVMMEKRDL
jgi:ATP-dependent DNA helicase RecQ